MQGCSVHTGCCAHTGPPQQADGVQVKAALEDQYAGKAANDAVGALAALLKDSPRVNPRKGTALDAFSGVPQVAACICMLHETAFFFYAFRSHAVYHAVHHMLYITCCTLHAETAALGITFIPVCCFDD